MAPAKNFLDTFDHVVVLMMENRSFDNILGHLYDGCLPERKKFEGAQGQWNPDHNGEGRIYTSSTSNYHQPFPDPGEAFQHVISQLYGRRFRCGDPVHDLVKSTPLMTGFVEDYYQILAELKKLPEPFTWPGDPDAECRNVMKGFSAAQIPALGKLAREFAVFDHWFAAVPSETWPNRAFWHAATSWGWVNNPASKDEWCLENWIKKSATPTLFDLLDRKFENDADNWRVYEDLPMAATKLIHLGSMLTKIGEKYFRYLEYDDGSHKNFFHDCAAGDLPKYAFLEPHLLNYVAHAHWHNDMHPSEWLRSPPWIFLKDGGPGSVLLGDQLIWQIYQAIKASPCRDRTLLVITFDEHGGCFDHVPPPGVTPPNSCDYNIPNGPGQCGFDFTRLGPRVPMVMISSYIGKNTIVDDELHHCSFLKTMQRKWGLESLGPRQDHAPCFAGVLPAPELRCWPDLDGMYPTATQPPSPRAMGEFVMSDMPLNHLQSTLLEAMRAQLTLAGHATADETPKAITQADAQRFFERYAAPLKQIGRGY